MGTHEYPWVSKYPWITRIEIPARVRGRARYNIYPQGRGHISYYLYPRISIDIPSLMFCVLVIKKRVRIIIIWLK